MSRTPVHLHAHVIYKGNCNDCQHVRSAKGKQYEGSISPSSTYTYVDAGASPGFGRGGGQEFFFSDLGICMSRSDMLRMAKPCALLGGFGGMLPRENFLKRCNLVSFRVYFD